MHAANVVLFREMLPFEIKRSLHRRQLQLREPPGDRAHPDRPCLLCEHRRPGQQGRLLLDRERLRRRKVSGIALVDKL
jgi:hypothetical protein